MRLKTVIANTLLIAVSLCVTAAAIEFGTRVIFPAMVPSGHLRFVAGTGETPTLGPRNVRLRQIKNTGDFDVTVAFNKYGFRDAKDLADSRPGDYFVVGDSLSFGWGVEESQRYSDLLQAALKQNVFNLCIPGDLDDFEKVIDYAERNGAKIDNLLLAISMGFNLKDYEKKGEQAEALRRAPHFLAPVKQYLMTHSAFYFLATSLVHKHEALEKKAVAWGLIRPNIEGIAHKAFSEKTIESTARRTARLAKRFNTIVVIAHSRALWIGSDAERKTADKIHREFIARLKALGLDVVDVRPAFEATGNPLQNYFVNDGHWSAKGHQAAAKAILAHIKAKAQAGGKGN